MGLSREAASGLWGQGYGWVPWRDGSPGLGTKSPWAVPSGWGLGAAEQHRVRVRRHSRLAAGLEACVRNRERQAGDWQRWEAPATSDPCPPNPQSPR